MKYAAKRDLEPELAIHEYIFTCAQHSKSPDAPRIDKIVLVDHFVDQRTKYLVMEHIKLQESPPDLAGRIAKTMKYRAPFDSMDVNKLDEYMKKVRLCIILSSVHHR